MQRLDTVKIAHPTRGFAIINATAFDPARHTLFQEAPAPEPAAGITKMDILTMPRDAVETLLVAHGVTVAADAKLAGMRKALIEVMFVDL